jgi:predicted DNA-binding antitoxin AbrB/MazE fold protein
MKQPIAVVYENGALRPEQPLPFDEHQRLWVTIQEAKGPGRTEEEDTGLTLPAWCNVYEGLSDDEVADLEKVILQRADLTRPS